MVLQGDWVTLYDVRRDGPGSEILFPLVGLVVLAVAVAATRRKHFVRDSDGRTKVVRGSRNARRFLVLALAWLALTGTLTLFPLVSLRRALESGHYEVVEGSVDGYVPSNIFRNTPEVWSVDGRRYEFYDAKLHAGFHRLGLVRGGMYVRIADVDGTIARLEVSRQSLTGLRSNER